MHLDMTITLGNVIQIGVIVGGLFLTYSRISAQLATIETRLGPLWSEFLERRSHVRRTEDRQ